jgi:hypothetical protein
MEQAAANRDDGSGFERHLVDLEEFVGCSFVFVCFFVARILLAPLREFFGSWWMVVQRDEFSSLLI